jgi:hypothetical protein
MSLYKALFETQENKFKTGIIGMIIITASLAGVFYYEAEAIDVQDLNEFKDIVISGGKKEVELEEAFFEETKTDYTSENSETKIKVKIEEEMLTCVKCSLRWTDEDSDYQFGTNEPDEFQVIIQAPNGDTWESGISTSGSAQTASKIPNYDESDFEDNYIGDWTIIVEAGNCGDDSALLPFGGLRTTEDSGNGWTLTYSYIYMREVEEKK